MFIESGLRFHNRYMGETYVRMRGILRGSNRRAKSDTARANRRISDDLRKPLLTKITPVKVFPTNPTTAINGLTTRSVYFANSLFIEVIIII